jgi:hypothetical protein
MLMDNETIRMNLLMSEWMNEWMNGLIEQSNSFLATFYVYGSFLSTGYPLSGLSVRWRQEKKARYLTVEQAGNAWVVLAVSSAVPDCRSRYSRAENPLPVSVTFRSCWYEVRLLVRVRHESHRNRSVRSQLWGLRSSSVRWKYVCTLPEHYVNAHAKQTTVIKDWHPVTGAALGRWTKKAFWQLEERELSLDSSVLVVFRTPLYNTISHYWNKSRYSKSKGIIIEVFFTRYCSW